MNKEHLRHEIERQIRDLLNEPTYNYLQPYHKQLLAVEVAAKIYDILIPAVEKDLMRELT